MSLYEIAAQAALGLAAVLGLTAILAFAAFMAGRAFAAGMDGAARTAAAAARELSLTTDKLGHWAMVAANAAGDISRDTEIAVAIAKGRDPDEPRAAGLIKEESAA